MIYTFWTGGFDSTFRICQLSREDVVIQPIYVIDPQRKSVKQEIAAIERITAMLTERACKAEIKPLIIHNLRDIVIDPHITEAFLELKKAVKLGDQYEWLAQVSKWYPAVELGAEKHFDGFGGCSSTVRKFGVMAFEENIGYIDQSQSSAALNMVMGNFRFPIINCTGLYMTNMLHEWGYDDIIAKAWFCHTPVRGKPCGVCRPCQQKIEDRMQFLVDSAAMRRYTIFRLMKKTVGETAAAKLSRILRCF